MRDVTVSVLGLRLEVLTGPNGRFRIHGVVAGQYVIMLRKLGYSPGFFEVLVRGDDTARVTFTLLAAAVELPRTFVKAPARTFGLEEFEERRRRKVGQFMTSEEIERLNFVATSDLLRTFRSIDKGLNTRGFGIRPCPYRIYVDGVPVTPQGGIDDFVPSPKEIAGIEVYANSATVPLQYASLGGAATLPGSPGGAACGVILFWRKH